MVNEFFPYRYQDNGVTMKITNVHIDGLLRPELIQPDIATVDLVAKSDWKIVDIDVEAQIAPQVPDAVLPEGERAKKPWHVVVVATSMMGNTRQIGWRQSEHLIPSGPDKINWAGCVRLSYNDIGAVVRLRAFVTRSDSSPAPQDEYADEPGLRLAASEEWVVQVDPRSIPPGKSMKIEWINFRSCGKTYLNEVADSLYYLDLGQDFPILYLNEDIPDLKTVLSAEGHVGPRAAIRDALFRSIAQPVWTALAVLAATNAVEEESERPEWQRSVLDQIAPHIYKDESEEDAVKRLVSEGKDPNGRTVLLQKLMPAVQHYLDLKKVTGRLFRDALQN